MGVGFRASQKSFRFVTFSQFWAPMYRKGCPNGCGRSPENCSFSYRASLWVPLEAQGHQNGPQRCQTDLRGSPKLCFLDRQLVLKGVQRLIPTWLRTVQICTYPIPSIPEMTWLSGSGICLFPTSPLGKMFASHPSVLNAMRKVI